MWADRDQGGCELTRVAFAAFLTPVKSPKAHSPMLKAVAVS
jgi:hypothetical protein